MFLSTLSGWSLLFFGACCFRALLLDIPLSVRVWTSVVLHWGWMRSYQKHVERPRRGCFYWTTHQTHRGSRGLSNDKAAYNGIFCKMMETKVNFWELFIYSLLTCWVGGGNRSKFKLKFHFHVLHIGHRLYWVKIYLFTHRISNISYTVCSSFPLLQRCTK